MASPESRITNHESRNTHHGSRKAFTLIELLIVIGIMAILASLIFPVTRAVNQNKIRAASRTQLVNYVADIENYKSKFGHYPPDNPGNPMVNQLYYELSGTTLDDKGAMYTTLDKACTINVNQFSTVFGPNVGGFVNSVKGSGGEEGPVAVNFLKGIKAGNWAEYKPGPTIRLLVGPVDLPSSMPGLLPADTTFTKIPWQYISSNPTNNPGGFDLWLDVLIGGKTNRICNWSRTVLVNPK